jgi:hypothetical protein
MTILSGPAQAPTPEPGLALSSETRNPHGGKSLREPTRKPRSCFIPKSGQLA